MAPHQPAPRSGYDAIVVLGTTVLASGAPSPILHRRLTEAARLFAQAAAPVVIVAGGRRWGRHVEATVMQQTLVQLGVRADAIVPELLSLNTVDNAFFCAQWLTERGLGRIVLVTSHWHMRRSLRHFRAVGLQVLPHPARSAAPLCEALAMRLRETLAASVDWFWAARARTSMAGR